MRHAAVASSFVCFAATFTATGLLAGCPDRSISEVDPIQGRVEAKDIPVNINRKLDLLFVIDDSPSMADKQKNLGDNFPRFIEVLSGIPGGLPDVHIGVVTSDLGTKGTLDAAPGPAVGSGRGRCSGTGKSGNLQTSGAPLGTGQLFISDELDEATQARIRNYDNNMSLAQVFRTMATVGAEDCGFEQHLEAMRQALQPSNSVNAGFLRNDPNDPSKEAFLAVIFIADEDDCSMTHAAAPGLLSPEVPNDPLGPRQSFRCTRFGVTCAQGGQTSDAMNELGPKTQCQPSEDTQYLANVAEYVTFLRGLKSDPNKVIVAGIMGDPSPFEVELRTLPGATTAIPALAHSCKYNNAAGKTEVADPPIRIKAFLDQFPNRNTFSSICQQDLSGGLQLIAELLKTVIGDPCITGKLAPQHDCSVSALRNQGTANETEEVLPRCNPESSAATNKPCWYLFEDATKCNVPDPNKPPDPNAPPVEHWMLKFEGVEDNEAYKDAHIVANCVTESSAALP